MNKCNLPCIVNDFSCCCLIFQFFCTKEKLRLLFSSLDELLLQRIDDLDDFTRKILHLASVLGQSFSLMEMIGISENVFLIKEEEKTDHIKRILSSLHMAVEEGILDQSLPFGVDDNIFHIDHLYTSAFSGLSESAENETPVTSHKEDYCYAFCHDTWRDKILSLLLDSYKRDIHKHISIAIESSISDIEESDYRTKLRLFNHIKESGNTSKAADLAVNLGKNFMHLGLNQHSIHVYNDALDMWRKGYRSNQQVGYDHETVIGGMSQDDIEALDESDLLSVIKLFTALGQALGTLHFKEESSQAFEDALKVSTYHLITFRPITWLNEFTLVTVVR